VPRWSLDFSGMFGLRPGRVRLCFAGSQDLLNYALFGPWLGECMQL